MALVESRHGKISKRDADSMTIKKLKEKEIYPMAINNYIATMGTSISMDHVRTMNELISEFDISKLSKSSTILELEDILRVNTKILRSRPFNEIKIVDLRLTEDLWKIIHKNVQVNDDIKYWCDVCFSDVCYDVKDVEYIHTAMELLPVAPWDETTWSEWIAKLKDITGKKGKDLFMPLRVALTGLVMVLS